jgi:2-polyprenyl-3-methyl-5-hydroxy-6-metoxy-1,4-benzoquinol methylase/ribosomal protein S27E
MTEATHFSEDDIRPDIIIDSISSFPGMDKSAEKLVAQQDSYIQVPCPACAKVNSSFAFKKQHMHFVRCHICSTVYQNPRPTLEMLQEYYCGNNALYQFWNDCVFGPTEEKRREVIFKPRVDRMIDTMQAEKIPFGTLLEVGSGYGTFCVEALSRNLFQRVIALEPTGHLADTCRYRGLEVIEKTVEDLMENEVQANVIASFEVIEHLFSPFDFLSFCKKALAPGGLIMLSCPNMEGFDTMVLKEKSRSVGGGHINMLTPKGMEHLMERTGFTLISLETPGRLDAELVRKAVLKGEYDLTGQPFLKYILLDTWEQHGKAFQDFLATNGLSSHMLAIARRSD